MPDRRTTLCALALGLLAIASPALSQSAKRIPLSKLQSMFDDMRTKTKWNVDGPLLWGYFFLDPSEDKLKRAASELAAAGYSVVGLERVEGQATYRLHVEKVELHSPMSLHFRNGELYSLADKYGLASYDGMDVGPAPSGSN